MRHAHRRQTRHTLLCTRCGVEITAGQEYWACNGDRICAACLADFARQEFQAFHETRGKEAAP